MALNPEHERLREQYLIALIEATLPLQQAAQDREITLELLIAAAELLQRRLRAELDEFRQEKD